MRVLKQFSNNLRGGLAALAALALVLGANSNAAWSQSSAEEVEAPMQAADQLYADGNYADAIPLYKEAHDRHGSDFGPLLGLGRSLMAMGQYDEALTSLLKAHEHAESNPEVLEALGTTYLILGDPAEARSQLEAAKTSGGSDASLYSSLGTALAVLGEVDLAVGAFSDGLNQNSGDPDLLSNMGLVQTLTGRITDGIANLEAAASSPGSEMDHRLNLAFGYLVAGDVKKARRMASVDLDAVSVEEALSGYSEIAAMAPPDRIQALLYGSSSPRHDLEKPANFVPSLDPEESAAAVDRILNPPSPPPPPVEIGPYLVFFDWDEANILPDARAVIEEAAREYAASGMAEIILDGHADRSGSDPYNLALSDGRANAVREVLLSLGIDESVITAIGRGEHDPLVETPDGMREPQNRRVLITLRR